MSCFAWLRACASIELRVRSRGRHRPRTCAALAALAALGSACGANLRSSCTEDQARSMVPVPVCLKRHQTQSPTTLVSRSPADYWRLLLPGFDAAGGELQALQRDCAGRPLPPALFADGVRSHLQLEQTTVAPVADGMRVVWLPSHEATPGRALGLVALLRWAQTDVEIYALGLYEGALGVTEFAIERMGPSLIVTATEQRCAKVGGRCRARVTLYGLHGGRLARLGSFATHQFHVLSGRDAGLELSFSASVDFHADAVVLNERLSTVDPRQGELRSSELERRLVLKDRRLVATAPSLWAPHATDAQP